MVGAGTAAVVAAAGSGERLGAAVAKAFCRLGDRTLLEHAVAGLLESGVVDRVVAAVPAEHVEWARSILPERVTAVPGGTHRAGSVGRALAAVGEAQFVLVHDAARALAPASLIARVVAELRAGHPAVVPALAVTDTIKAVDAEGAVLGTPERAGLRAAQTPQGFRAELLRRAYQRADLDSPVSPETDDAAMVERIGGRVRVVDGDPLAFKITSGLDLLLARAILGG